MINNCFANQPKTFKNVTYSLMPYPNYENFNLLKNILDFNRKWNFTTYANMSDEWEQEKSKFFAEQNEKFQFILVKQKDISGTKIREAIKCNNKNDLKKMLPRGTIEVITNNTI